MTDQRRMAAAADCVAPDGSEIRLLVHGERGSLAHCRLAAGATTFAVQHRSVEELWFVIGGAGEIRRGYPEGARIDTLEPGVSVRIPTSIPFQFRAHSDLEIVLATMPPWPGDSEAVRVEGGWSTESESGAAKRGGDASSDRA